MYPTERLSEEDLFGRFFLKKAADEGPYKNYYASLDIVKRLIRDKSWLEVVTGYYINAPVARDTVRLSYFTSHPDEVGKIGEDFIARNGLQHAQAPEIARSAFVSEIYGREEIRFRRFLYISTLVALDVMEKDLLYARRLFATFRFRFMKTGEPYEEHFLKAFEERSQTYCALREADKKQFWLDLKCWPNPPQVDWIHLPVNMVLTCDINSFGKWKEFIASNYTLDQKDIEQMLKTQSLEIPGNWRP